jgi:hypothetical protein
VVPSISIQISLRSQSAALGRFESSGCLVVQWSFQQLVDYSSSLCRFSLVLNIGDDLGRGSYLFRM